MAACFEYFADLAEALDGKQRSPISLSMENFKSYVLKEPIGVVGLITPWYDIRFHSSTLIQQVFQYFIVCF